MLGTKYLGEIIKEEKIELGTNTLIVAPTGSGKTHYILNDLCTEDKKCLYICDTNNLKYSVNYSIAQAKKDNIRVMNYHKFGKIISGHADDEFIEDYDYIIADECHNLIKYQGIDNNGYLMASRMKLFKKYEHCKIVFFTATPETLDELSIRYNGIDRNFNCLDFMPETHPEIKRYTESRLSYYTDIDREFREYENYFKLGNQCLIFTAQIETMKKIECICNKYDYLKPISIWSTNNEKVPMSEEQEKVRKYLLQQHELMSDYNILIINKATETGINIEDWNKEDKPHRMNLMICNSVDDTEQIQSRGRIRHDIDFLVFRTKDTTQVKFHIDEDILDKWWSKGLIEEFIISKNNMRDSKGRLVTVKALTKELEKYGYAIKNKKFRDKEYYAQTGRSKNVAMYKVTKLIN